MLNYYRRSRRTPTPQAFSDGTGLAFGTPGPDPGDADLGIAEPGSSLGCYVGVKEDLFGARRRTRTLACRSRQLLDDALLVCRTVRRQRRLMRNRARGGGGQQVARPAGEHRHLKSEEHRDDDGSN